MKIAVIGSGLASFACCTVLNKNNFFPDVFDCGEDLDLDQKEIKIKIKKYVEGGNKDLLSDVVNIILQQNPGEHPKKKYFGSEKLYNYISRSFTKNNPAHSNNLGGFGKVWSASALFPDKKDLTDWPDFSIPNINLYNKYFNNLNYSAKKDNLEKFFTKLSDQNNYLKHHECIEVLQNKIAKMNTGNFVSGFSKSFLTTIGDNQCRYCGLCMTGCVYNSIFDPSIEFKKLIENKKINYYKNFELVRISKLNKKIELFFSNGEKVQYDKVFLAAGALSSSKIIMNSFKGIKETKIIHASGFVMPLISLKSYNFEWPNRNTLSQIFMEIKNKNINHWVHCQLSQPNELVMHRMGFFKFNNKWIKKFYFQILKRLFTINIGYHSNYSGYYKLNFEKGNLKASYFENKDNKFYNYSIYETIMKKLNKTGLYSNKHLIYHGENADHYYIGGSFPMKKNQTEIHHSDQYGQLKDMENLHIIDSSTFPSIPATTFGLLIILNSARITDKVIKKLYN
ncbi:GMC family oxidoreductase [Pelagibacteraceae bacterium]|nr:GMC family oxidoreductase [Pelagibacteraceae bacterium]